MEEDAYVTSTNVKYGRLLTISEESVYFDQTGEILRRAARFGEKAKIYKERLIINGIQDVAGFRCWAPNGIQTDFWSALNSNCNVSNPLGDAGLTIAHTAFHNAVDSEGDPVLISPNNAVCLVPIGLWTRANELARSPKIPEGVSNAINTYKGTFTPLTSPFITAQSVDTWYFGDFKKSFAWLSVWPLQTFRQKPDSDYQFKRDISQVYKVRMFGSLSALDKNYVQKSTA